jgi:arylsulfatase A-like enzyme
VNKALPAEALARLDKLVGQLMDGLKQQGIAENTLVVLMADNGPFTHHGPDGMVCRGGKGDFWEGGVRVPAMARWPGVIKPRIDRVARPRSPSSAGESRPRLPPAELAG